MSESNEQGFVWERRVEFCETDAAGIAHFSSFFLYMEQAEHALFRSFGSSIFPPDFHDSDHDMSDRHPFTWPRVRCECEYFAPVKFEDILQIHVRIERLGAKSITYLHDIYCRDHRIARGRFVVVCSEKVSGKLVGCRIPDRLRESLAPFVMPSPSEPPSGT